jgi:hypothetical protein
MLGIMEGEIHPIEEADPGLQRVLRAHDAVFWRLVGRSVYIDAPKRPGDHREYKSLLVDATRLDLIRHRLENNEPLQDFEALEAVAEPTKRRRAPRVRVRVRTSPKRRR